MLYAVEVPAVFSGAMLLLFVVNQTQRTPRTGILMGAIITQQGEFRRRSDDDDDAENRLFLER